MKQLFKLRTKQFKKKARLDENMSKLKAEMTEDIERSIVAKQLDIKAAEAELQGMLKKRKEMIDQCNKKSSKKAKKLEKRKKRKIQELIDNQISIASQIFPEASTCEDCNVFFFPDSGNCCAMKEACDMLKSGKILCSDCIVFQECPQCGEHVCRFEDFAKCTECDNMECPTCADGLSPKIRYCSNDCGKQLCMDCVELTCQYCEDIFCSECADEVGTCYKCGGCGNCQRNDDCCCGET